jgi:hypothetical protein
MSDVNVPRKRARTILSDGINKYFLSFLCGFMASVRELNCHTVYLNIVSGRLIYFSVFTENT